MLARWGYLGAVLATVVASSSGASAAECAPARLSEEAATLPGPWRRALEALVAATAREGQPWSCPDARVTLVPPGDRGLAQLEVEDASGVRRRPVASPADVLPLGEAMLARAFTDPAFPPVMLGDPPAAVIPAQPSATGENPRPPPFARVERKFLLDRPPAFAEMAYPPRPPVHDGARAQGTQVGIDLLVGARYTGPTKAVLVGPELRATLGFGRWFTGLVARYDTAVAMLQPVPPQFSLASVTVGLAGGYRLLTAPIDLSLAVEPTLGVVLMGAQGPDMSDPDIDARVDMRLGARLGAAIPVSERVRVACAIVGEGVPAALFTDRHAHHHSLPSMPGYMAGLSLGMELLAIR